MQIRESKNTFSKIALGVALSFASLTAAAQTTYTVIFAENTASPTNPTSNVANNINNEGQIIINRAFSWLPPAQPERINLQDASGEFTFSTISINDVGVSVGKFVGFSFSQPGVIVNNNGVVTNIGTGFGRNGNRGDARPNDVNNAGDITGSRVRGQRRARGFIYSDGRFRNLGTLGGDDSNALAINEQRQVVGQSRDRRGRPRAFLWENGRIQNLGTLSGLRGFTRSLAADINDAGVVVGWSEQLRGDRMAFVYEDGRMTSLGSLDGERSEATAINNNGVIVGSYRSNVVAGFNSRERHAAVWVDGEGIDLNAPGVVTNLPEDVALSIATDINDEGVIIGYTCSRECAPGRSPFGRAFALIPNN